MRNFSVPYEMETEIDKLFKKDKEVCVVCGYVSANEFFSFPSDVDTRQKWAAFCKLPYDTIKPDFRLCDQHFRIGDYRISIQLIPTSVPSRQPKGKHGCAPSINNSLQSGLNSIDISNPTVNKNASKNAIYSPVFQSNTATDASNKQFHKDYKDITSNYDDDVPPKGKKFTLKRKLKDKQSRQQTKCFRSEISRLRTRCSRLEDTVAELTKRIEQLEKRCLVVPAEIDRNIARDTHDRRLKIYSLEKPEDSSHNTEALPEKHYEKVALVESIEKVAEDGDGYCTDSSMPPLEISNDDVQILDESFEQFSEERCSRYSTQDPASIDSQNCFLDLTKATDDVKALDDDEIVIGISVSPQINRQLRKSDTSANSNNEQFDAAHVGQTLQQPNYNDKLNAYQKDFPQEKFQKNRRPSVPLFSRIDVE